MIKLGGRYSLEVVKQVDFGFFLDGQNLGEVLLPNRYAPEGLEVGDSLVVFLYLDSDDRPVATTQTPMASVGEFACLRVADVTRLGAFLDWGLEKDLFLPFAEQHKPLRQGNSVLVYLYLDPRDGRIVASSKIDKYLEERDDGRFEPRQAVELIIAHSTQLGLKAIIDQSHWGLLHQADIFQRLSYGQRIQGFIKRVREDGKIDLTLHGGQQTRDDNVETVEQALRDAGGYLPLHDKSDPQQIQDALGMSKGAFKQAIGKLYKRRAITIEADGIRWVE